VLEATRVALLEMTSQLLGATDLNGPHHLSVRGRQGMGAAVSFPVQTKDIGQLDTCPFLSCRQLMADRQHRGTRLKRGVAQIEQIQRTRGGAQLGLADLQIALGALKRIMAQQRFNGHQVHSAL